MDKKTILCTGSLGLLGSAIRRIAPKYPQYKFEYAYRGSKYVVDGWHCDLRNECEVKKLFQRTKPNYVIHLAARVGGIKGNLNAPDEYYSDNILMNTHMVNYSFRNNVEKFIGCSSICAMPDNLAVFNEKDMHSGNCYLANEMYGFAKRGIDVHIRGLKNKYGNDNVNYMSLIPGNIAGAEDNYDMENGHVLPCLVHKMYIAKRDNTDFEVWGDGSNLRQFVNSDDMAYVMMELLGMDCVMPTRLLVCGEKQHSIKEIVNILAEVAGFKGNIVYNTSKPGGQLARMSDISLFRQYFPLFKFTDIREIVSSSWNWFNDNYEVARK